VVVSAGSAGERLLLHDRQIAAQTAGNSIKGDVVDIYPTYPESVSRNVARPVPASFPYFV
jgi:hypothetical protein